MRVGVLFVALSSLSGTLAGGCSGATPCGDVLNQSNNELRYTTNPNANIKIGSKGSCAGGGISFSGNNGYCHFHNWNPKWPLGSNKDTTIKCTQCKAPKNKRIGNNGVDVDAFTFPGTDWYLLGAKIKKGVWHQIHGTSWTCHYDKKRKAPYCSCAVC
ncbi:hypothetical protein HDV00_008108 [Rhizophlyctis rosea]|nr:hypothetical protein HDV00_008108 [Rhizophlyctis rosea]